MLTLRPKFECDNSKSGITDIHPICSTVLQSTQIWLTVFWYVVWNDRKCLPGIDNSEKFWSDLSWTSWSLDTHLKRKDHFADSLIVTVSCWLMIIRFIRKKCHHGYCPITWGDDSNKTNNHKWHILAFYSPLIVRIITPKLLLQIN